MFYYRKDITENGSDKYNASSEICNSPKSILNHGRIKMEKIVKELKIKYLPESVGEKRIPLKETTWKPVMDNHGGSSCYTLIHFPKLTENLINRIQINLKMDTKIYVHSPGSLKSGLQRRQDFIHKKDGNYTPVDLRYEVFKILNTKERPCNDNPNYNPDECFEDLAYEESMAKLNCTWPFLNVKDNICTDKERLKKAIKIGKKYRNAQDTRCPESCTFADITVIKYREPEKRSYVRINYAGQVKVIESYFVYDGISLVAEIGGYVGLFLGYSIKQITEVVTLIVNSIKNRCSKN